MKVVYAIAANFGGHGIGYTALKQTEQIFKAGVLKKVCVSHTKSTPIPKRLIASLGNVGKLLRRLAYLDPTGHGYIIHDNLFDFWASRQLRDALRASQGRSYGIFHGWNHHCLLSLRGAKKQGAVTVVERASAHPLLEQEVIAEEHRRFGIKPPPTPPLFIRKCLAEFEEADYITVPSDFAYQTMVKNGINEKKLAKIPFGVDLLEFNPALNSTGSSSSKFLALFVGQISLRKGILYLLEAWEKLQLKDAELWLVGNTDRGVKKLIRPYLNQDNIKFLGFRRDVPELMAQASIFVFPSLSEGSALVTYEAMAAGLPLVTTFNAGSAAKDNQNGFIVPVKSADALADAIKYLHAHPAEIARMGNLAKKSASRHTWDKYGQRLLKFYRHITK